MQIAKVIPKIRTSGDGIFDYSIPPEILPQIKRGILIEVPFRGRKIEAVIVDIKHTSKFANLKPISKVIDQIPVIDDLHLELSKWMSDYYLAPIGQTLFECIVPPAKRTIKKLDSPQLISRPNIVSKNNKFLIIADFNRRLNFYLKAIEKTIKRKQSVLILIPDLSLIDYFLPQLKDPIILHANLTKTQRWLAWDKARRQPFSIVIGSQSALFAPINNLGLIIIDQIENSTYKNDRSPRFSSIVTAEKLAEISSSNLVFGSLVPDVENYYRAIKKYKILKHKFAKPEIGIVDTSTSKGILSETLINNIEDVISKKNKVLLVYNRKGDGNYFSCSDCGWVYNCPECNLPLKPLESSAICRRCEKDYELPRVCSKCSSVNLKKIGIGTKNLAKIVSDFWPKAKVINLEKDGDNLKNHFDIAIATSYALKLSLPKIGLVGILDADSYMYLPDFHSAENSFGTFYKFLKMSPNGIIQTSQPDGFFARSLASLNYELFFENEIELRKKESFPPFVKLINLIYQNVDEKICQQNAEKMAQDLKKIKNENFDILGPNPAFVYKKLNKFRWQIIIKLKNTIPEDLRTLIAKQRDWICDIDPVDLI